MNLISRKLLVNIRVGSYLAYRQLKRGNMWTNLLIVSVMVLTFLNLTVVRGILVGLVEGLIETQHHRYTSDIIISTFPQKNYIENSPKIITFVQSLPEYESLTARYQQSGTIEANYENKTRQSDKGNKADALFAGIDPKSEDDVTGLSNFIIEGSYLSPGDYDQILVGQQYLRQYQDYEAPGFAPLDNVKVGTKVRVMIGDTTREVTVKGIVKAKIDQVDRIIFFPEEEFKTLVDRHDENVNEIAIKLKPGSNIDDVRQKIISSGAGQVAKVQTFVGAQSKYVKDLKTTFSILGLLVGFIGVIVASITIFIVIFINAITRRKYIGILEGVGINSLAIKISYVIQSMVYAVLGIIIGSSILFGILKPYFASHPINFPLSDGILVATYGSTFLLSLLLVFATLVAGYIPARFVVRQNVLDAILGR